MKEWIGRIWQTALAAFVVASLGVGVSQLQATARVLDHCHSSAHGHCADDQECRVICRELNFEDGNCVNGCCFCLL